MRIVEAKNGLAIELCSTLATRGLDRGDTGGLEKRTAPGLVAA